MDLILKDIFKNKIDGIYVDVGAQHPIKIIILINYTRKDGEE